MLEGGDDTTRERGMRRVIEGRVDPSMSARGGTAGLRLNGER
jgi:hypothetical protein